MRKPITDEPKSQSQRERERQLLALLDRAAELIDQARVANAAGGLAYPGQTRRNCVVAIGLLVEVVSALGTVEARQPGRAA